jgi:hypothetical protein
VITSQAALLLREVGVTLYGQNWRAEMARRRNVTPMIVRRWETASKPIPEQLWTELREELQRRKQLMDSLLERLPP